MPPTASIAVRSRFFNEMPASPELVPANREAAPAPEVWRRALPWLAAYAALEFLLRRAQLPVATPHVIVVGAGALVSIGIILLSSAALFALVARPAAVSALAGVILAGALVWIATRALDYLLQHGRISMAHSWPIDLWQTAGDLGLICLGAGIGAGVAAMIRDRNILLPAGVFAAFADFFMVKYGTVRHALHSAHGRQALSAMSAHVAAVHPSLPAATMGMADFVFLAFFFACAGRFGMNARGTFWLLAALLSVLLFSIQWLGAFPAVLPMALGFVLVNLRYFKLSRAEIHATLIVFCLMAVLVALFFVFVK
jgi:hypothetical protein